jgi:outer membrane protein assembly factor BamB
MPASSSALLYVGIKRSVLALDAHSGEVVWEAELPGRLGSSFVTVYVAGGLVYAASAGEITCLDAHNGAVVWHNKLKGYGQGFVTLATAGGAAGAVPTAAAAAAAQAAATAAAS